MSLAGGKIYELYFLKLYLKEMTSLFQMTSKNGYLPMSYWGERECCFIYGQILLVPLADANLSGPRDAFEKGFQTTSFLSLLKRDIIIWNPATT